MENEELIMKVNGKKSMSGSLGAVKLSKLNRYDFEQLQCRAAQQIERIEAERLLTVPRVFSERNRVE